MPLTAALKSLNVYQASEAWEEGNQAFSKPRMLPSLGITSPISLFQSKGPGSERGSDLAKVTV